MLSRIPFKEKVSELSERFPAAAAAAAAAAVFEVTPLTLHHRPQWVAECFQLS